MLGSAVPMTRSLRFIVPLIAALALASCGGEAENTASSSSDVNELLKTTAANVEKIESATVDAKVDIDATGQEPITASLSGPFESQGADRVPKLALNAQLSAAGQSFDAGVAYDGSKGYVTLMGTSYEVSDLVLKQFVAAYEQALKSSKSQQGALGSLGIDFKQWLPDAKNEGEADVGGTKTIKIGGDADVDRVIEDIDALTKKAGSLGLPGAGSQVPQQLTPQQKQAAADAIKRVTVTVYTGAEDQILRRFTVDAEIKEAESKIDATLRLDVTLTKVNQKQTITTPDNPKPFSELLKQLDGLGLAFGGSSKLIEPDSSGATPPSSKVEEYADCIEKAAGDQDEARKCASILAD